MRELDDFIKLAQQRAMRDLWDNDLDARYDFLYWTQQFGFDYTNDKTISKKLGERISVITTYLNHSKNIHTEVTGHTKFSLLKTSEMTKELVMTFYYECLECLQ